MQDEISKELKEIIGPFAKQRSGDLHLGPETRLAEDLGVDSPRMIDIMLDIEDRFGITIDENAFQGITTVGELTNFICECSAKNQV